MPDARIEPQVGGAFQIYIDPLAAPGMKGADDMRVMAVQPQKISSLDRNAPPHLAEARKQRTFVVVRFEPLGDKLTRVSLHHTGWGDGGEWDTDLRLLRPRLGGRARQHEEALRQRPAVTGTRVARATAQDARRRGAEGRRGRCGEEVSPPKARRAPPPEPIPRPWPGTARRVAAARSPAPPGSGSGPASSGPGRW